MTLHLFLLLSFLEDSPLLNPTGVKDVLSSLSPQINYEQIIQSLLSSSNLPPNLLASAANLLGVTGSNQPSATSSASAPAPVALPTPSHQSSSSSSIDQLSNAAEQYRCHSCTKLFATVDNLFSHLVESQHLNNNTTSVKGPGLLCWKKGCNQYFKTTNTLKVFFFF